MKVLLELITDTVVAVPRSKIIIGFLYSSKAAAAPTIRSAPISISLSRSILKFIFQRFSLILF